mmetsp:Transcript_67496/g.197434  ORF Transcript_67496/g.197434 Transcript_67496/m.197434 type:complete len:547 (-) Transcript_67496:170-1810(-)
MAPPAMVILAASVLGVVVVGGSTEAEEAVALCGHGTFNRTTFQCHCDEGWKVAGPTDTINFFKGRCTQFRCASSSQCEDRLGIVGASCPVLGWDCYCGWEGAFGGEGNSMGLSAGYQTWGNRSAACQGPLYTLSFSISDYLRVALENFWMVVLLAAAVMLPFGQTHVRCRCYDPGMFRLLAAISGCRATCDGRCTIERCSPWMIYYDLAWSIYVLDVGIWVYAFLVVAWLTFLVIWGVILWIAIVLAGLAAVVMAMCSDSGGGGGGGSAESGCCNCASCECPSCCQCCDCCQGCAGAGTSSGDPGLLFYAGGPFPGDSECRCDCCSGLGKCFLCLPLAKLFLHFPRRPANMWGGIVGYCFLGTHPMSRVVYLGGSRVVDLFGFRGERDLHDQGDWRRRFAAFLQAGNQRTSRAAGAPAQQRMPGEQRGRTSPTSSGGPPHSGTFTGASSDRITFIHSRRVGVVDEVFDRERDNCRSSSFEDYEKGECWICCDSKEQETWDLWLQCGHLFCTRCSQEMLQRKLPCPLCRQVSFNVKRGPAKYQGPQP